ncbi:hypothetical protein CRI77_12820 [Mycolicibacterium duvalii]|uniref:Membrane protein n=1 Tax=Mycolicibacterium duvalii TaxID=39688 RepID=A0A7I7JUY8_9MYCO|nr:hypothetical protein [Mycolicibacterium duvalii]MCV7370082.1 hypothetical protein [Mycolicibacterium duvalii]PEG40824.1 hypothetical protein CRI77_12820 [Mycolicibacterium duvalii]BBX15687.1 membrane protein [Mycolicibacterium duvalii]
MPSFRRRESVIDTDRAGSSPAAERVDDAQRARALAEEAEAEAAEAEARAAAARARAKAIRLRREAEAAGSDEPSAPDDESSSPGEVDGTPVTEVDTTGSDVDADEAEAGEAEGPEASAAAPKSKRRLPRPGWRTVAASLVIVCTLALLGLSGFMVWKHREAEQLSQQRAEYAAAGRQSVVTLMSLDFNNAEEDVQRIIDNSTGQFKTDFETQAQDFVKVAQDSKVVTEVSVNSTAVDEMTDDTAEVLVAASSRVTNTAGADGEPRTWRLSVSLQREGGQIKMSKVEFVP